MKKTSKSGCGTSFHDTYIKCTVQQLTKVLGFPQIEENTGRDKVNFEWICINNNNAIVTIYDWKEFRKIKKTETIKFHIGGTNNRKTELAKDELLLMIANI